jgi:hypothetical protein
MMRGSSSAENCSTSPLIDIARSPLPCQRAEHQSIR